MFEGIYSVSTMHTNERLNDDYVVNQLWKPTIYHAVQINTVSLETMNTQTYDAKYENLRRLRHIQRCNWIPQSYTSKLQNRFDEISEFPGESYKSEACLNYDYV